MICPKCGAETRVLDTRVGVNNTTQRRRECLSDKRHRFSTFEVHAAVYCSAKQRGSAHARTTASRIALRKRDEAIAAELHLGWRVLAERYSLTKTAVYLAAKRGRNAQVSGL